MTKEDKAFFIKVAKRSDDLARENKEINVRLAELEKQAANNVMMDSVFKGLDALIAKKKQEIFSVSFKEQNLAQFPKFRRDFLTLMEIYNVTEFKGDYKK